MMNGFSGWPYQRYGSSSAMVFTGTTSTVLSTIGTVIWCVQLVPQIYFLHKKKNSEGFPPIFMLLWCISGIFMSIYFIISNSYIPLQIQPHLFTILCSIAWVQSMYYPPYQYHKKNILLIASAFYFCWMSLELGFAIWLRKLYTVEDITWPDLIFGIVACVFLCIGLLPPYYELSQRRGRVVGINFVFLFMDSSGAIFNMVSMCLGQFDPMGMTMYVVVLGLEIGLFLSQGIWLLRFGEIGKHPLEESNEDDNNANQKGEDDTVRQYSTDTITEV